MPGFELLAPGGAAQLPESESPSGPSAKKAQEPYLSLEPLLDGFDLKNASRQLGSPPLLAISALLAISRAALTLQQRTQGARSAPYALSTRAAPAYSKTTAPEVARSRTLATTFVVPKPT